MASACATLANVVVTERFALHLSPQTYFLRTGGENGTYSSAGASVALGGTPLAVGAFFTRRSNRT